jgi:enamine deaminase RidA (YjgF/YER057c/UK114 family)
MQRKNYSSTSPWENILGYSRAVKTGNIIEVSGTTATDNDKVIGAADYYLQTKFILEKIEKVLITAGATMNNVTRTRIYVCDISKWEDVARAHAEYFMNIKPAATMIEVSKLISPELLVEIEVTAVLE